MTGLPDLIVDTVKLGAPPVTVSPGGTLPITVVVRNQGFANAAGSTVKLSLVVAPGTAAPIKTLLEFLVPAIAEGAKQNVQMTATIRPAFSPATTWSWPVSIQANSCRRPLTRTTAGPPPAS